jgi:hypothetical protein
MFLCSDQGGSPVAISMMVQPRLQISENLEYSICFTVSGAIQFGVPFNELCCLNSISSTITFAPPKSDNLHNPLLSTKIFAPFISKIL